MPARLLLVLVLVLIPLLVIDRTGKTACLSHAISRDELNAAIARPAAPFTENVIHDEQLPVNDDVRQRVEDVLGQVVACSNAGEPLRVWALYSGAYLSRLFQIQGQFTGEQYAAFAAPRPATDGIGMDLERIDRVWQRADGIVVAQVVTRYSSVPMPKRLLFWFAVNGDRVEIEEVTGEISFSLP